MNVIKKNQVKYSKMKSVSIKLFFHMYMDCSASVAPPLPPATDFLLSSSDETEMESLEEANPNLEFFFK